MAGDKARGIHPQRVPLDDEGGVGKAEAAAEHRERRRRHHQRHDAVADHAGENRSEEEGLRRDLAQRPAAAAQMRRRRRRQPDQTQQRRRDHAQPGDDRIAAGEGDRSKQVARPYRRLRTEQRRGDAAGEDQRDRLRAERLAGRLRGGEPVLLDEPVIGAEQERAAAEYREGTGPDRQRPR